MSDYQRVYDDGIVWNDADQGTLVVKYDSSSAGVTGLGLRIHFDSSSMALVNSSHEAHGALVIGPNNLGDVDDNDADASTDSIVNVAWTAFGGNWPGSTEADLITLTFEKVDGGNTNYGHAYTSTSNASGFDFIADPSLPVVPLDVIVNAVDENSGSDQVIAVVEGGPNGATYSLVDNTDYGSDAAEAVETVINTPALADNTANIYVADATFSGDGSQVTVQVAYNGSASTNGLGILVHYDGSALSLPQTPSADGFGALVIGPNLMSDADNADASASTDSVVNVAWTAFTGGWPGSTSANLLELTFDVAEGVTDPLEINFSSTSTPPGIQFVGQNQVIQLPPADPSELSINAETGEVTLTVNPDFETRSEYSFDVVANAGADPEETISFASQTLVNNLDEASPGITSGVSAGAVDENGGGQVIYTATADDSQDISAGVTFALSGDTDPAFSIDAESGEVYFDGAADYENQSDYTFTVIASDGVNADVEQAVTLDINNLDEEAPSVDSSNMSDIFDENSGAGQVIYTATADDSVDVSEGVTFSLSDDASGAVSINGSTGEVTFIGNPDYENDYMLSFSVIATDAAGNASVAQSVTLDINNLDDTAPIFMSGSEVSLTDGMGGIEETHSNDESSYTSQLVYTATANDDQNDMPSGVSNYIIADDHGGMFSIDSSTGDVYLDVAPDYEDESLGLKQDADGKYFEFTVTATDAEGNASDQQVKLYLKDVAELPPIFNDAGGNVISSANVSVDENNEYGAVVYTAYAEAHPIVAMETAVSSVTYSLSDDSDAALSIDSGIGQVYFNDNADYEVRDNYSFTVVATDTLGNVNQLPINLAVNNLDEVAPTITSDMVADDLNGELEGQLDENSASGQVIYTATADDSADTTDGVTFSLAGGSDAALSIDANSGEVTLDATPDHEAQSQYSFTVVATDAAGNVSDEQSVTLDINDLDDAAPTVTSDEAATSVDENSGAGQVIYTATADDSGDNVSDGVTFSLAAGSDAALSIDANTGAVTLATDPDHEAQSQYSFTVVATDAAGNEGASQAVTLDINDLDDTAATITSGDTAVAIDENSGAGQVVYTATADDSADVNDGTIVFSLSDDSNGLFSVDAASGEVSLSDNPNFEAAEGYSFTVVATDGAGNASSKVVSLPVTNLDDTAPIISAPEVPPTLSSYSSANQTVYVSNAVDDDSDVTSEPLTYTLEIASEYAADFSIDVATGEVTYVPMPFTEETLLEIPYSVIATDGAGNKSPVQLQLNISGKEFNAPLFEVADGYEVAATDSVVQNKDTESEVYVDVASALSGGLDSTVQDGDVIYTAAVFDDTPVTFTLADSATVGENSAHNQIIYNAVSTGSISIDINLGKVTIAGVPWVEGAEEFTFAVVASDSSGNQSRQDVSLDVSDYAVAPQVNAGDVSYSLADGHHAAVEINAETGEVILLESPDHEAASKYEFVVEVNDNGATHQHSVVVDVVNTDDVAPTVTSDDTADSIDENSGAGQLVYTASADDTTDGSGNITFSLTEESDPELSIDASSGEVRLAVNPDYEGQSDYSFAVVATDDSGNASAPQSVSLSIGDIDEINPVISSASEVSIDENIGTNQVIYNAVASNPVVEKERGPISIEFDQNSDGVVTLKLYIEESLANQFSSDLQGIQFNLNYASDAFSAVALESVDYTSSPFVKALSESEGTLGFALTYLPEDDFVGADVFGLYDAVSSVAIAELSFNVGANAQNLDFSVSDVGIIEYGIDLVTHPSGQAVYELDLNNSDVTYALGTSGDYASLTINQSTGAVALLTDVDAETLSEYNFTVIATDLSGNSTDQHVSVAVNDLDEWSPAINSNSQAMAIQENSGANQVIYTATADDTQDISGGVSFSLASSSDAGLSVDSETGAVSLRINPDFEEKSEYSFTVIATDAAGHSSDKLVTLDIKDLDEVAPSIVSATTHSVNEGLVVGDIVYTALATDSKDVSDGITFSLTIDSDPLLFIDSQSGVVRLLDSADFEAQSKYNFTVVATDKAGQASEQAVTLRLNDLDEQAPSITSEVEVSVSENVIDGQVVYRASADDSADISAGLSYELLDGSDIALSIDGETGVVTLGHSPDFEAQSSYTFTVVVRDGIHSSNQAVKLTVDNIDEATPTIELSDIASITENSGTGNVIYTASATDDTDTSGGVTFSLADGSDAGLAIDALSGDVTLSHNADFEAKDAYSFIVVATDAEGNFSSMPVSIDVDSLTHVDVTHWNSGVGIANSVITIDAETVATDVAGEVTHSSTAGTSSVSASKQASDADKKAIDVGDALAALDLVSDTSRDNSSYQVLSANVDGNSKLDIGDVLSILKFAAGVDDNSTAIGNWSFAADPVAANDNDSYAFTGYLTGDVDGSWGTYSARTSDDNEVTIHMDENALGQSVFNYDKRAMDIHSVGEGLSASGGVISLASALDFEARPTMSFTLRDKASGELLVHNVQVGNVDESAPEFLSDASVTIDSQIANGDVIYTATADDSADISAGVVYSLAEANADLAIDDRTGDVTFVGQAVNPDGYSFTVVADDGANPVTSQPVAVNLHVADTDAPVITSGDISGITEQAAAGSVIYTATADDALTVTYSLARGSDKGVEINETSGAVTLVDDANFEHQMAYSFTLLATDAEGNSSEQSVTIQVGNVDEVAPEFTSADEAVSIDENSGENQVIYTATAIDSADISGGVTFSLKAGSDAGLSIDALTGAVILNTDPDHEQQNQYSFTVVATDAANNASEQSVTLDINDLDDATPAIDSSDEVSSIDENSGAFQVVYSASADDDFDVSEGVVFSIDGHSGFSIDPLTGDVTLSVNPDQEIEDNLSFTVIATDAAGNWSDKILTLNVNDLDDTAAVITSLGVADAINENSGAGQVIYTATADDSADVQAAPIRFSLADGSDDALSIDAATGEVSLADNPDHEIQAQYSFTVVATDDAGNVSEGQSVTLSINDLDEAAPEITSADQIEAVVENSGENQVIYTVTADDSADLSSGVIVYSLSDDSDAGLSFDAESGEVSITASPDAETQDHYSFTVIATDSVGNASEKSLTVSVTDIDEQAPTFNSANTANAIDENSGHNQVIYSAQADGNDDAEGASVTYSLEEGHDTALAINGETGEVYLLANPDADAAGSDHYSFTVVATDAVGSTTKQAVTLNVNNLDDTAPTVTPGDSVVITENRADLLIYTAIADDSHDVSGGVTFSLAEGSDSALSINAETGDVSLSSSPDYEAQSGYQFTVVATDAAGNISASNEVNVAVVNLDEVAPVITSGISGVAVIENSDAGQVVYRADASDTDTDFNDAISYSFAGAHDGFAINALTGEVSTTAEFNYEIQTQHSFVVIATDGSLNQSVGKPVTVVITNLDDTAPEITSATDAGSIVEETGAGQVIYTATADDSADISSGPVLFSLAEGSDTALSINAETGEVTLTNDPDYEVQVGYTFTVVATDAEGNFSEKDVTLAVTNNPLDDYGVSVPDGLISPISENSGAGQVIYTAAVINGVSYALGEGSDPALSIDSATGNVTLADKPDADMKDAYSFSVIATNVLGDTDAKNFTLNIANLDDTAPVITSGDTAIDINFSLNGQLNENSEANQVIYTAEADDSADISGGVSFSLTGYSDNALSIDSQTGEVTLTESPDYETQSQYNFTVIATDAAGNASEQAVSLDINNLDDTAPVITSADVANGIDENSGAEQVIYTATADDSADAQAAPVTFSLADGSDSALSIEAATGEVSLAGNPDHETQAQYSFSVVATDGAGNVSDAQAVTVAVSDLDDAAPTVISGAWADPVMTNSAAGQVVYTVVADDSGDDVSDTPLVYSLSSDSHGAFSIDSATGAVTLVDQPIYDPLNDPMGNDVSELYFTVVATDGADNQSGAQSVTLEIANSDIEAPVFMSPKEERVNEGNQVIYVADVADESAVTFSLRAGSDLALEIDENSGFVSIKDGNADYETQNEYQFVVEATDTDSNTSSQLVTVSVDNVDEVAPEITSADSIIINQDLGGSVVYSASASDTDFNNQEDITFGLDDDSNGMFTIDAETGDVSISPDVDGDAYSFTVTASDAAGNKGSQTVDLAVAEPVNGQAQGDDTIGAIEQKFTQNADGSYNLQLFVVASPAATAIENMDFTLNFTSSDIEGGKLTINQPSANPIFNITNDAEAGEVVVSQVYFPFAHNADSELAVLDVTFDLAADVSSTRFTVNEVLFNADPVFQVESEFALVNVAQFDGTSGAEVYSLEGGPSNIVSGAGNDTFVVTEGISVANGESDVVIDFESGQDSIELGQLLMLAGYGADNELNQVSGETLDLTDLIESNDHLLDNAFGAYLDSSSNTLTMFIDSKSGSDSVDVKSYEVTLAEGSTIDDDDLSANLSAFTAFIA